MSLLKLRISWSEDDTTFRDIEILSGQTYDELHTILKKEWGLPADMQASFFVSDDLWRKGKEISSTVEKNLRDAVALSMKKTPIGALIVDPHQKFVYVCDHPKAWEFHIDLLTLLKEPADTDAFPRCTKVEGLSPALLGVLPTPKDSVIEVEERYDLNQDEEGFGDEGEGETSEEEEESHGDEFTQEDF